MPSRQPQAVAAPPPYLSHHRHPSSIHLAFILIGVLVFAIISLLVFIIVLYRKLSRNRTAPTDSRSPNHHLQIRRFSYSLLRRATASFSPSCLLGHGGFGSVYKATIPSNQAVAVKLMDPNGSLQGEREFHNELSLASSLHSPYIVSLLGYASHRRKLLLVYELMENRSLQDALLDRKCPELMGWNVRFSLILDISRGLEYLHHYCTPPVIHGDIKPSNILVDCHFKAKIGDFGLARVKSEDLPEERKEAVSGEDNGSILEETESIVTGYEESAVVATDRSPESFAVRVLDSEASPDTAQALSPELGVDKGSVSDACFDKASVDSGKDLNSGGKKGGSRRDWWWKQDNGGESESGRVKDYVMEWIGSEIKKERPKGEWIASASSSKIETKKRRKRLEWWASLDEERIQKKEKNRKPREWWKEEFCEELTKKKKKKRGLSGGGDAWWQKDVDVVAARKKRKSRSSRGSIDWWLDSFSGEFRHGGNSQDWTSGEIPKSGGVSSTPSMRGTVCYIAPEYGGGGLLSEKCDVYSFGVLLLVVVSGRRPLQVTASPMSEFERANLISWARQLAYNSKLLDLVDPSIHSMDKEQALLCITIALLCLQKSPSKRPTMKEIVCMLSGEAEPPHLPFEFSPSPPSNFPFKSRKKAR
ncbi:receptor-like serine/threonine-protein kinase [Tripterygium wilfordii]|uniref:non-specific serine/threonine protein kinase n=1 Tax=Tripterygium wilfordii TaxID=458696 RepID=A0A7J7DDB5_TRIWF|nr:receptor-like serine/threonine-protein kinase At2g45590 [Tripterygium wilfordii]KAF5744332.1 receptor-like serine/threonine-protein kinase [Tripterygium wilfordii]